MKQKSRKTTALVRKKRPKEDYQTLKTVWYKKLAKSGFDDIEPHENTLKEWTSRFRQARVLRAYQNNREYYTMADQFLNNYKFEAQLDRVIWEYHTNAVSVRNIAVTLNKTRVIKTNKDKVLKVITRLTNIMKGLYLPGYKEPK